MKVALLAGLLGTGAGLMFLTALRPIRNWKRFWVYAGCVVVGAAAIVAAAFVEQGGAWLTRPDLFWVVVVTLCVVAVGVLPWELRRWHKARSTQAASSRELL